MAAEWYRKTAWSDADKADFFDHLARARADNSKAQYLRIQALHLQCNATPPNFGAALELLDLLSKDFPNSNEIGAGLLQRAKCLEALGRTDDALEAYRGALKADVGRGAVHTTEAPFEFAMFVLKLRRRDLHNEVLESFKGAEIAAVLPQNKYKMLAAMALIAADDGRADDARNYATQAVDFARQAPAVTASVDAEIRGRVTKLARGGGFMALLGRGGKKR